MISKGSTFLLQVGLTGVGLSAMLTPSTAYLFFDLVGQRSNYEARVQEIEEEKKYLIPKVEDCLRTAPTI